MAGYISSCKYVIRVWSWRPEYGQIVFLAAILLLQLLWTDMRFYLGVRAARSDGDLDSGALFYELLDHRPHSAESPGSIQNVSLI